MKQMLYDSGSRKTGCSQQPLSPRGDGIYMLLIDGAQTGAEGTVSSMSDQSNWHGTRLSAGFQDALDRKEEGKTESSRKFH